LEPAHGAPELLDHAHALVAEDRPALHPGDRAVHEVDVRAADRRERDAHDRVARLLDHGIGHVLDAEPVASAVHDGFHVVSPLTARIRNLLSVRDRTRRTRAAAGWTR